MQILTIIIFLMLLFICWKVYGIDKAIKGSKSANIIISDTRTDLELLDEALKHIKEEGRVSTSFLQRKLQIGYARAASLMDILEEKRYIGHIDDHKKN